MRRDIRKTASYHHGKKQYTDCLAPALAPTHGILREFPELEKLVKSSQTLATYAEEGFMPCARVRVGDTGGASGKSFPDASRPRARG